MSTLDYYLRSTIVLLTITLLAISFSRAKPAGETKDPRVMCNQPPVKGHCRALLTRWMYNTATGDCQQFNFGGCDGNDNNFTSYKACMASCGGVS